MHGKTLMGWRAKRAGGRITVYGHEYEQSDEIKIVGVDVIQPSTRVRGQCIATDKDGTQHILLP